MNQAGRRLPAHIVDDVRLAARWLVERARAAWVAGLDSLFVGDRHVTRVPYYQNSPLLGQVPAALQEHHYPPARHSQPGSGLGHRRERLVDRHTADLRDHAPLPYASW